jgi:hypothetical protein
MKDIPKNEGNVVHLSRIAVLELIMERMFYAGCQVSGSRVPTKEEFFGFRSADVVGLHRRKYDEPYIGLYFRLRDGRVIDALGRGHDPDPLLYDLTH